MRLTPPRMVINPDSLLREKSPDPAGEKIDIGRVIVQAGDMFEGFAAGFEKRLAACDPDLLQGFKAVGGEGRGDHDQAPAARAGQAPELVVGVGCEPGFSDKP